MYRFTYNFSQNTNFFYEEPIKIIIKNFYHKGCEQLVDKLGIVNLKK